jgi:hypothetical protein
LSSILFVLLTRLDFVGDLPEDDALGQKPLVTKAATLAENDLLPIVVWQVRKDAPGQDVAAVSA